MSMETFLLGDAPRIAMNRNGSGELVLFLHGVGGNRTNWDEQLALIGRSHHAVAWDARGYGMSDDSPPFEMSDLVDDVTRVLDHFETDAAHLVGLSMGALIALSFYFSHRDRVKSLFLANSAAGLDADPGRAEEFLASRLKPLREGRTPADIAPAVTAMLSGRNATDSTRDRLERSIGALRVDGYISALGLVARFELPGDLATISVPAHYVGGEDDRTVPPEIAAEAASRIPGCSYTLIERTGHLSNIEAPDRFNEVLARFLQSQRHQLRG